MKHTVTTILLAITAIFILFTPLAAFEHPVLLITDREENVVHVVNADTYEILTTVPTGKQPREIVVTSDGKTAYVSNFRDHRNTITVIDLANLPETRTISPTPNYMPHGMAISRDNRRLFVTCEASKTVAELSIPDGKVLRAFDTEEKLSHMLVLSPDEKNIFTANSASGNVTIIDVVKGTRDRSILSGGGSEGLAITNDGLELWVTNRRADSITIIDTQTQKVKEKIECRGYPIRADFTPDGTRAVVVCSSLDNLTVFDKASRENLGSVRTKLTPAGFVITPDGKRAYTANFGDGSVTLVNLETLAPITSFEVGTQPFGIVYIAP